MKLTGKQCGELVKSIECAFPSVKKLELLLKFGLDKDLLTITAGGNLTEQVSEVIKVSEAEGWTENLLKVAKEENPNSPCWENFKWIPSRFLAKIAQNIPESNPNFMGREDLLKDLESNLAKGKEVIQVIYGLGGVGKTQLAIEYLYRYKNDYKVICWVNSEHVTNLKEEYSRLAVKLGRAGEDTDLDTKCTIAKDWLDSNSDWLIVFDNVESFGLIKPYIARGGHNLITSRSTNWWQVGKKLKVRVWTEKEALSYLSKYFNSEDSDYSDEEAKELVRIMGYLPLALEQAVAYMESKGCSLNGYINRFQNERKNLWTSEGRLEAYFNQRKNTVANVWKLSLEQIENVKGAKELMGICSYLAPENIPLSLFTDHTDIFGEPLSKVFKSDIEFDNILGKLRSYSLIDQSNSSLSIHRLVQTVVRDKLGEEWLNINIVLLAKAFNFAQNDPKTWEASKILVKHVKWVIEYAWELKESELACLCGALANYYRDHLSLYSESETLLKKAIEISKITVGKNHIDYVKYLNDLAGLLWYRGRYEEAESLYRQVIEIAKSIELIGEKHPDYAVFLCNFANLLSDMGKYKEAESFYKRAIEIDKITIGEKHFEYAMHLASFADFLIKIGHYKKAKNFFEQAIEIDKLTIGQKHPDYAIHLNSFAVLLSNMGKYEEAISYYRQIVEIDKITIGEKHSQYAISLSNLANSLRQMEDYKPAEELYRQAIKITEDTVGKNHPDYAININNLAGLLESVNSYKEAELLYRQAIEIDKLTIGQKHPDYAIHLNNLANLLRDQNRFKEAEVLYRQAIKIDKTTIGKKHSDYAIHLNCFAKLLGNTKRSRKANSHYKKAIAILENTLGTEHITTKKVKTNYQNFLNKQSNV